MSRSVRRAAAEGLERLILRRAWRAQLEAFGRPSDCQRRRLETLLSRNADTVFGRRNRFGSILRSPDPVRSYQDSVPAASYEDLEPLILRAAGGEPGVLTAGKVLAFERSSGSLGGNKLIPFTRDLLQEFQAGIFPWMHGMGRSHPLRGTTSYWSISAMAEPPGKTAGGSAR